jgi:hypothetical protein
MKNNLPYILKNGIIAGVLIVAYFLLFYLIKPELLFNPFIYWASLGILIAIIWKVLLDEKKKHQADYTLNWGLQTAFGIFVVANLLYYLFYYLLFGLIDPGLIDVQKEVMAEALEARKGMLPPEQIQALEESMKKDTLKVEPGGVFFTYLRGLIGNFVVALGLAYFVNRQ